MIASNTFFGLVLLVLWSCSSKVAHIIHSFYIVLLLSLNPIHIYIVFFIFYFLVVEVDKRRKLSELLLHAL